MVDMPTTSLTRSVEPFTDLSSAKMRVLDTLAQEGDQPWNTSGEVLGVANLADLMDLSRQQTSQHLDALEEYGFVQRDPANGRHTRIELTQEGFQFREQVLPEVVDMSENDRPTFRPHYVTAVLRVDNSEELREVHGDWRRRWVEQRSRRWMHQSGNDSYTSVVGGVLYRFHRESVVVMLKRPVVDYSVTRGMNRAMAQVYDAIGWVRRETPCDVGLRKVHVATTHIGMVRGYLAEYVKRRDDLELGDFEVVDREDGGKRYGLDESTGQPEEEAFGGETAEEDMRTMSELYDKILHNKESARRMVDAPEMVDELREKVANLEEKMRNNAEKDVEKSEATPDAGQTLVGDYYDSEMRDALDRVNMR